ncbi:MAG: hypothetical protein ACYC25_06810 [Paludibacter sp.]
MRIKITFLSVLLLALFVQGCSVKARIKKADKSYAIGEYYAAGDLYRNVLYRISYKDKPLRGRIAFQAGECYRIINNNNRAVQAYLNAIRYKYSDTIVYLHYAQVLQRMAKYVLIQLL